MRRHTPSAALTYSDEPAVAFFTSWSNSFTEIFSRAVMRLYELWSAEDRAVARLQKQVARDLAAARTHSAQHGAAASGDGEEAALVPSFKAGGAKGGIGGGTSFGGGGSGCALNIVFADRKGRRKIANILDLVARCSRWQPPPPHGRLTINCTAHDFGVGLIKSLPTLWRADVLVVSHGADIINGFGMHAGASVLELMPPQQFQYGCPCDMYRRMYSYEGPTVLHYQLVTSNGSRAVSTDARKKGTYNSDLFLPWGALDTALRHVLTVGGRRASYKFKRFQY
ncbi:hypothetical protein Ctob_011890 [Chrysochromulina tobinii]|uniref:Uncharacterized protein n=1 Tax=Chrysochromulina tobinii TaxID=1460289 RepID=A0A0M0K201_9EUKA|nr:hypothetical protein Ctob_011890 [Chrysochromulina tobinii]|eukprot:KOO32408.1 hypothetical protein Ctob_011890 [Chrysochromulina sp. CCMP291]